MLQKRGIVLEPCLCRLRIFWRTTGVPDRSEERILRDRDPELYRGTILQSGQEYIADSVMICVSSSCVLDYVA